MACAIIWAVSPVLAFSITFVAAPKCEVHHHSIAWFPSVEKSVQICPTSFCQSISCKKTPGEGPVCCNTLKGHIFVTLVDTSVHRVMYQLPLSNMRAGEWWINTSKSHDSLPWSRKEKGKEPLRESLAPYFGTIISLSEIKMHIFPTSLQKCLPSQMRNSLPYWACMACERSTVCAGLSHCHIKGWIDSHTCVFICFQSFKTIYISKPLYKQ